MYTLVTYKVMIFAYIYERLQTYNARYKFTFNSSSKMLKINVAVNRRNNQEMKSEMLLGKLHNTSYTAMTINTCSIEQLSLYKSYYPEP